jgi:hypothetical protein
MAEKKFFVDINLQGSALTNAKIGTNSAIGSTEGAFGYDSAAHRLQYFDGTATKEVANLSDIAAVTGGLILQGGYDAATDTPNITDGSAFKGFFWVVTVTGTFLGESVQVGDSIIAKVDEAGATLSDWLILQGNVVIATETVDGIVRLATQTEANDGTEAGAVVITPATLQGKIDAQITPEISSKLPLAGGTMSGTIDMGGNSITNMYSVETVELKPVGDANPINVKTNLDFENNKLPINLPAPTNSGDATNKQYVDDNTSNKLPLAGGTMSGAIDMGNYNIENVEYVNTNELYTHYLQSDIVDGSITLGSNLSFDDANKIVNLPAPTNGGDATNKTYVDDTALTAENNAKAYADSLAPNYDPAGSASTAESNANSYTDTAVDALSFGVTIATGDWTFTGTQYTFDINHNLNSSFLTYSVLDMSDGVYVEASIERGTDNFSQISVNNLPNGDFKVSVVKAGGNL